MSEYEMTANAFAKKWGVALSVLDKDYRPYFPDDRDERWVYKCRLSRNGRRYTFTFGQSIAAGDKKPTFYDIFACLQKYDCGTFENFCDEFGYNTDSRKAERTYKAVCKEYNAVVRLFGDNEECMEELTKIY